jgi:hypothetical protein
MSLSVHLLSRGARVLAAAIALACLGVLVTAALLDPDTRGHGTHQQLGLPACGWATYFGKPCITCGMTTAFALAADGRLADSFRTQPMGMVLAVLAASTVWAAGHAAVFGSRMDRLLVALLRPGFLWTMGAMLLGAWVYKMVVW